MMTFREAKQRLSLHNMRLSFVQFSVPQEYRVEFCEDHDERNVYITDDLEDAALTGASMRRRRQ